MVFRPPLYQKMYPFCSAIVEKMPVKSIKMFCFRLQVPCYNVATKYVPLLRCTTLSCFHPFFVAVWNSAYNFCTTLREKRAAPLSRCSPHFSNNIWISYLPKYRLSSPANALPWRASSRAISCTVSWIASRLCVYVQPAAAHIHWLSAASFAT